jgi:hypothetical protein
LSTDTQKENKGKKNVTKCVQNDKLGQKETPQNVATPKNNPLKRKQTNFQSHNLLRK